MAQVVIEFLLSSDAAKRSVQEVRDHVAVVLLNNAKTSRADVSGALETLNRDDARHIAGLLALLANYVAAVENVDHRAVAETLHQLAGAAGLTSAAVQAARADVRVLGVSLKTGMVSRVVDEATGLGVAKRLINVMVESTTDRVLVLTPLHAVVLEALVSLRAYRTAARFITEFSQIVRVDPPKTGSTVLDHLTYWYLAGQVFTHERNFERAQACYFVCLSTRANAASALAVAATIKHSFCSMLLRRDAAHFPSAAPTAVVSAIQDSAHKYYRNVVDAYNKRVVTDYQSCIMVNEEALRASRNWGLAQQVVLALRMRIVQELPAVYSRVPLEKVRADAGVHDLAEARSIVLVMASAGFLDARVDDHHHDEAAADGTITTTTTTTVTFGGCSASTRSPSSTSSRGDAAESVDAARLQAMMVRYAAAAKEMVELQSMLETVRVDVAVPAEVLRLTKKVQQASASRGGGGGGGSGAAGIGGGSGVVDDDVQVYAALEASLRDT
jgi:hypothetical protein